MIFNVLLAIAISVGGLTDGEKTVNIQKLISASDFKLLLPGEKITRDWKFEVKWPYPLRYDQSISNVRLHYFDRNGNFMIGIEQHKASGYTYKKEMTKIDLRNRTSQTRIVTEHFQQEERGEVIHIGKAKGYFEAWGSREPMPGGILHWIQGDTYVEMDSGELTKEQMVEMARSMK
ncbi:hypothetical protein GRF59_12630 [Paenibacillus sp. HJL G12]|uniref:DUF4367 domain-containing protein n=1 Tax=Paenibacillus dendrobii TaxID=2691084 RepID=A0A7X3IID4_9BACL|nr:hypothetical protein [Paenibacillus dendrobii]MWV44472.1 hypothetical protein [Paenibacillus dendrobii]